MVHARAKASAASGREVGGGKAEDYVQLRSLWGKVWLKRSGIGRGCDDGQRRWWSGIPLSQVRRTEMLNRLARDRMRSSRADTTRDSEARSSSDGPRWTGNGRWGRAKDFTRTRTSAESRFGCWRLVQAGSTSSATGGWRVAALIGRVWREPEGRPLDSSAKYDEPSDTLLV
ncbi:hypothetical protein MMC32_008340 [Xylographa parallela]|nr:hypothetical protein [Xylographa parallela]